MCANPRTKFGAQLREFREAAGFSQEELADRAGLSVRGISDLERGARTTPRLETVRMLADALELNQEARSKLFTARGAIVEGIGEGSWQASERIPNPPTSFVGREMEIERIVAMLEDPDTRLVTLIGPGGVGKTRIAIEVARYLEPSYKDAATFVDLSPIRSSDLVIVTLADTLGVQAKDRFELKDVLSVAMQNRRALFVLDNLEQVLDAAHDIAWLLASCPQITIIATSRIPLKIRAEHVISVEPMKLPTGDGLRSVEQSEAVKLLVTRAKSADNRFTLNESNATHVASLVWDLQGMPLAIELAASRLRLWSISELLERLRSHLPVLYGGARDAPTRQRTMRDTVSWSYDLMSTTEQAVFRTLSVFPDGCTLESCVSILGVDGRFDEETTLTAVEMLIDGSILRRRLGADNQVRYGMMPPVREFGLEQLAAEDEEIAARLATHYAWCVPIARRIERGIAQDDAVIKMSVASAEYQNLREHIKWLTEHSFIEEALDISSSVAPLRALRGHIHECSQELLALLNYSTRHRNTRPHMRAQIWLGILYLNQADIPLADETLRIGLSMARALRDQQSVVLASLALGVVMRVAGEIDKAEGLFREVIDLSKIVGDRFCEARGIWNLGLILEIRGDQMRGTQLLEEGLALNYEIGNLWDVAFCKLHLGAASLRLGFLDIAESLFNESRQLLTELEDKRDLSEVYLKLAEVARRRGDIGASEGYIDLALTSAIDVGNMIDMAHSYLLLARVRYQDLELDLSKTLTCQAIFWYERCGSEVDGVRCLDNLADVAIASGDTLRAAWCIGAVDAVLDRHGIIRTELEKSEVAHRVVAIRSTLDNEAFETQHSRGRKASAGSILAEVKSWLSCNDVGGPALVDISFGLP